MKFFNGNYTDYRISLENQSENNAVANKPSPVKAPSTENSSSKVSKLSFKEQKELETLEKEIQDLEQKKQSLIEQLNAGDEDFQKLSQWANKIEEIKKPWKKRKFAGSNYQKDKFKLTKNGPKLRAIFDKNYV